jgi:hypothetical protein
MAADRSDDAADQPDERPDHPADRPNPPADHANQSRRDQIEPRSRQEAYDAQRANESPEQTEPAARSEPGTRSKPPEPTENAHQAQPGSSWEETKAESRWMWGEYKRHWPEEERPPVDTSEDDPGSWRADADRVLKPSDNQRIEAECDRIEVRENEKILPALRAIESQDPHRHLVGLEHHLKDRDRIKEKVCDTLKEHSELSPDQALSLVPDALRYTFQYEDARYTRGVYTDIARLQEQGFELNACKNFWSDDQYRGVNSQWIEPVSGQRFEVQFHTCISYEAKQLTHPAYERIRAEWNKPDKFEQMVLEAFQKKVTAEVPVPPGATDIPNYKRGADAR